jgi:hypothetical protein
METRGTTFVRSLFFVTLAACVGGVAVAGTTADEAHAFHDKAKTEFALGKFTQAAEDFERAFELKPDAALLYNAAQAHRLGGDKARALSLYQNYLRVFGHVGKWAEVEARVDELKRAIAQDRAATPVAFSGAAVVPKSEPPPAETQPVAQPLAVAPVKKEPEPSSLTSPPAATAPPATSTVVLVAPPANPADEPRPLLQRPAFWIVTGVVVAAAVATTILLATRGSKDPSASIGMFNAN